MRLNKARISAIGEGSNITPVESDSCTFDEEERDSRDDPSKNIHLNSEGFGAKRVIEVAVTKLGPRSETGEIQKSS